MGRAQIAGIIFVLSAIACGESTFEGQLDGGDDSSVGDAGAGADATRGDGGPSNDAGDDGGGDVPGNVLVDPGFETAGAGCGPAWFAADTYASISRSSTARHGLYSCMVCVSATGAAFANNASVAPINNPDAGVWEAAAWVLAAPPDAGASANAAGTFMNEAFVDSGYVEPYGNPSVLTSSWQQVSLSAQLGEGQRLAFAVYGNLVSNDAGTGCFLVDDVSLVLH